MSIASQASEITLPATNQGWLTVLQFLCSQFPFISEAVWRERIAAGKVHWFNGATIDENTPFLPSRRLCYYREVVAEPKIPFAHGIIYQDEHILVADKPHFLPVTPGGDFVNECLLQRLKNETGLTELVPVHRLDRDTAGLVLFSKNTQSRAAYYQLFSQGQIAKTYQALARVDAQMAALPLPKQWQLTNRIEKAEPRFLNAIVAGEANAHSTIELLQVTQGMGLFRLTPHTGKTHQLRLHMQSLGCPILHDAYYPTLKPKNTSDFSQPLQLLAAELSFTDPLTGAARQFNSAQQLQIPSLNH
ncbi:RNA pseudouridylate synthase [Alishewanella longhuensis]|uniref:RNA pseudouridylate synthase n=1 Tax=Alishewanella longhuensis TaxID=1091037 RepID=A0ABQ3L273_9ALTE|nr:pseudouridine synthase [Alishewanella longhuensis]GHG73210.1 RNA pseudouridylate synthase [Alishewanella longhuensis]